MEKTTQEETVWEKDNAFIVTCVVYMTVLVLLMILRGLFESGLLKMSEELSQILFTLGSQVLIMFLVPVAAMKMFSKHSYKKTLVDFGFGRTKWKVIGFAFLLGALVYILNLFVATFFQVLLVLAGFRFSSGGSVFSGIGGLLVSLVVIGVLPGVCEETSHRGLLMRGFTQKLGVGRAILFSALIFGLMHLNIRQVFYAAILGYIIAIAVKATRSIWTGVIIHFVNNSIDVYLSFARENNWLFGTMLDPVFNFLSNPIGIVLMFAVVWAVYQLVIRIIHGFARENYKKDEKILLAHFLKENPQFLHQFVDNEEPLSLDKMSLNIGRYLETLTHREQVMFYIDNHRTRIPFTVLEKTLLFGIIFLGSVITGMTFVWGVFL